MVRIILAALASAFLASSASAAVLTNVDSSPVVLVIVEDGGRMELSVAPGASEDVCPQGCFVTLPNGDRLGLDGGEAVEITATSATIK